MGSESGAATVLKHLRERDELLKRLKDCVDWMESRGQSGAWPANLVFIGARELVKELTPKPGEPVVDRELLIRKESFQYFAEASTLGFKPGEWPTKFTVAPKLGNGMPFDVVSGGEHDHVYRQEFGVVAITVLND